MRIVDHKYQGAVMAPSPNFTNRVITPRFIVMHYTAGWEVGSALRTFANANSDVSAQFTIDVDGTIYQHVDCNIRAWHAGPSSYAGFKDLNSHSIGIEFVNPGFLRKVGENLYQDAHGTRVSGDTVGPMVAAPSRRAGSGTFYWPAYTKEQIEAGEAVTRALIEAYGIVDIVSHEEIDTRGWKTDPGPAFPMSRFKALLPTQASSVVTFVVNADVLNVRAGPASSHPVKRTLSRGARVFQHARRGAWVQIGNDEWVNSAFLRAA